MHVQYQKARERILRKEADVNEIMQIEERLKNNKFKIIKHNYSLSHKTQNFSAHEGYMFLSEDGLKLNILTKKPNPLNKLHSCDQITTQSKALKMWNDKQVQRE